MFYAVPTLYAAILADPECTPERGSSRLRLCFSAGEPLPPHLGHLGRSVSALTSSMALGRPKSGTCSLPISRMPSNTAPPAFRWKAMMRDSSTPRETMFRTVKSARCWCARPRLRRDIGISVSARVALSRASGRGPATNTFGGRWRVHLLRPHRRHVQGQRHLGFALRGGGGARQPSRCARSGRRSRGGLQRSAQADGFRSSQRQPGEGAGRSLYEGLKAHVKQHGRPVEISALDRIRRFAAEDRDRKNPAFQAARNCEPTGGLRRQERR